MAPFATEPGRINVLKNLNWSLLLHKFNDNRHVHQNLRKIWPLYFITQPSICRVIKHFWLFGSFSVSASSILFRGTVSHEKFFYCFPVMWYCCTVRWSVEHWWRQMYYLAVSRCRKILFDLILYVPVNNFQLCRDWTGAEQGLTWQRIDAVEAQIRNTQAFYHWATVLSTLYEMPICCKTENFV